jgi:DUF2075 family protein/SOS-response transcriptional repressor LexA
MERARGTPVKHVQADGLALPWNFDGENWATSNDGIEQVGCVHTSQGIEFDWLGVLIGSDLRIQNGKVVGDPTKRAKTDASLRGWKTELRDAKNDIRKKQAVLDKVQAIIKSTYKVLLSRGRMGCYVWCADLGLREYLRQRLTLVSSTVREGVTPSKVQIVLDPEIGKFDTFIPLYSLEAAAGSFGKADPADCIGWVKAPQGIKVTQRHFVTKVIGKSMEPLIKDGTYCVLRFGVEGSRGGRIVLVQHSEIYDPETGGSYTIKKYQSTKATNQEHEWRHSSIQLVPINPDFQSINITAANAEEIRVIAEFVTVL